PNLVLYLSGNSYSAVAAIFACIDFEGKMVSVFFCYSTNLGEIHSIRNGFLLQDKSGTKARKRQKLYANCQSHIHDRYYVDVCCGKRQSVCFCRKTRAC